jgi:putative tricarboxylic transport membrane protein
MSISSRLSFQALIGAAVLLVGALLAWGALSIPSAAGYAGVGPNFLPWLVAVALVLCGAWLLWQALRGGYRDMAPPSGAAHGDWRALGWVAAGVLANAALITRIGFILSCTLCFALAVRGLRGAEGRPAGGLRQFAVDVLTGAAIAAPVYWLFTKVLAINLPGLTGTGWL